LESSDFDLLDKIEHYKNGDGCKIRFGVTYITVSWAVSATLASKIAKSAEMRKKIVCKFSLLFGTWLGTIRITWGKSPEWLSRNLRFSKRATVGVLATYATRWNSGMKRVKCGW
jgi:hypothetical protein